MTQLRRAGFSAGPSGALYAALSLPVAAVIGGVRFPKRFRAARRVAAALRPVFWMASRLGIMRRRVDEAERALGIVCLLLHRRLVRFPADVDVVTDVPLDGPLLIVARHSLLNQMVISRLVQDGHPVAVVMTQPFGAGHAFGTVRPVDVIPAFGRMTLRRVAKRLLARCIVFVTIDSPDPSSAYPIEVDTPLGRWFMSDRPLRLAAHLRVPMATCVNTLRGGGLRSEIRLVAAVETAAMIADARHRLWPARS